MPLQKNATINVGVVADVKEISNGVEIKTSTSTLRARAFHPSIVQITITKENFFEDFSYAVIQQPQSTAVKVIDDGKKISLATSALKLDIQKDPIHLSFFDSQGRILNEDEKGLGTSWIGDQATSYKKLQDGERFIGLGEKTGPLDRRGSSYQNWNTDAYGYHGGSDPLYCSMPFYIGVHHDVVYGIFLDNSHKTFFNFGASNNRFSSFSADCGEMNYYFIQGNTVAEIIHHYTWLTGRMEMPPLWSIGYQQCRYSYYPDKEVLNVARTFREKEIPADVIVLDIHYMEKYKIFTWDKKNFSNPKQLIAHLKELGFNVVVMCDPGIKIESGYDPYEDGVKQDVFIKYPDGKYYEGQVWPGWCHFPDFTNPKTRTWWESKFKDYIELGVEGFWNDMNEIATWGHALPENLEFDFEGNKGTTRRGRNLFGFQMARATYEGTKNLLRGKRPFNLTRSGFSGVQRYAAVWTGDNVSYDEHMLLGVRLVNSLGLTGVSFAGYDAGGFVGDAGTKLYARWMSIASLSPFFRGHTMINTRDSEPWSYGEEVEQIARNYIAFRYQLLPYIYSLFHNSTETGEPVQRSLAVDYTFNPRVYAHQYHNQYLLGPNVLVAPVESNRELLKVFLPPGDWYYLFDGKKYHGDQEIIVDTPIHKLPVFIKAGAIIPMQKTIAHTHIKSEELIIHVYRGPSSSFDLYHDDGETFRYQQGDFSKRKVVYDFAGKRLTISKSEGAYATSYKKLKLVLHGFNEDEVFFKNEKRTLKIEMHSFFTPLEKYDPINDPDSFGEEEIKTTHIDYTDDELIFTW